MLQSSFELPLLPHACIPLLEPQLTPPVLNLRVSVAVWMSASASDAFGKFCAIFLPISAFVAMGLDHSVANM